MNFSMLLGNESTRSRLTLSVKAGTLPHALLIVGPVGSGKRTMALAIAAAMNCERRSIGDIPCMHCSACKRILGRGHPDVKFLHRESGKATIGVDEVRLLKDDMYLSATEAEAKFYIAEEAALMTPQAQNALLKVFEEPPPGVHIILLSESLDPILTTIKSRAQLIRTELFDADSMEQIIRDNYGDGINCSKDELRGAILTSGGSLGKALASLGGVGLKEGRRARESVLSCLGAFSPKKDFTSLLVAISSLPQKRDELRGLFELMLSALRDVIVKESSSDTPLLFFVSEEEFKDYGDAITLRRAMKIQKIITGAISDIDKNIVIPTLLTDVAVRIHGIR